MTYSCAYSLRDVSRFPISCYGGVQSNIKLLGELGHKGEFSNEQNVSRDAKSLVHSGRVQGVAECVEGARGKITLYYVIEYNTAQD